MKLKSNILTPQVIFVLLAFIYGISFLLVIPPLQVPDEYEHYYKAWDVSNGNIIPVKIENKAGIYVPKSLKIATDQVYQKWMFLVKNDRKLDINFLINLPLKNDEPIFVDISKYSVVTYSPIVYLAPSIAIAAGKSFNLSPIALLYLGRFANLLLWIFIIFMAIRITPVFKWGFVALSLIPMTLFQATSLSADGITIALSFLLIVLFLELSLNDNKKKINKKDLGVLFLVIIALSLTKIPYFLLIFLFFMIPSIKFGGKKKLVSIFLFLFISSLLTVFLWNMAVKGLYMPLNEGVSIKGQLFYILPRPFEFLQIVFNSLTVYLHDFPIIFVGNWAFGDDPLPMWIYSTGLIVLIITALFDNNEIKINIKQKSIILAVFLFISGLLFFIEYLTWTDVGKAVVHGMQGRYFIPMIPLAFLLFYNVLDFKLRKLRIMIVIYAIISLTAVIFAFKNAYFI
ncbi:DUF2142 domain-containing protein [Methanobacterium sp. ACI-7]|uniref:DUF2142 domain-containing protein n=1 Tax=unclassified Methanobacterium TaxID=2627676 RepID=UPI0039C10964